jgi:hypothetical protein
MTIWSLLVSPTATTLGLAAFSPHAEAGDFPSFSFMSFRWESMRPELESYVSGISSALRRAGRLRRKLPKSARLRPRLHASRRNTSRPVLCCSKMPAHSSGRSTPRLSRVTNRPAGAA